MLLVAISLTAPAQGATSHNAGTASRAVSAQGGQRPLTPALARQLSRSVTDKVIIVLRNQFNSLPDTPANSARRAARVKSAQRGVLAELTATHARNVKSISLVNAVAATVSPGEAKRLAGNPAVAEVTPDLPIPVVSSVPKLKPGMAIAKAPAAGVAPVAGACPAKNTGVQLDPQALTNIHAASQSNVNTAQGLGYTGAGVKVAWIADGIDINNPDFIRANGQHVFVDYRDFSGTGTSANTSGGEAFLDASSIAAQGRHVYNVQNYGNGLSRPCLIRILGVAPGASLVGLNVFGSSNFAFNSVFLEAINWAVSVDHVNVLNESFGANPFPDKASLDLTDQADEAAVAAGVTVVASSGDAGVTNTIGSPATDPKIISAGATTTFRAYAQTNSFGIFGAGAVTGWIDNNISGISSAGFDQAAGTVDVVAPGDQNWTLCTPTPQFAACTDFNGNPSSVQETGGTSEAAPLTAGTAALVIQAYRKAHGGRSPSPAVVKRIIVSTAQDISAPAEQQGAGIVDAYQAVLAARSYPGPGRTQARKGHAILDSTTQLNAIGPASHAEQLSDTIINDGSSKVTVHLSSRTLSAPVRRASKVFTLTSPGFAGSTTFNVPKGQARLSVSIAIPSQAFLPVLILVSPSNKFAAFNFPQGTSNFGNAQVADPAKGTWTALFEAFPVVMSPPSSVTMRFLATTATFKSFGSLSRHSITLAPGASSSFKLNVSTPIKPGDEAGSIILHAAASQPGFAATTTIPVTLRSLVPVPSPAITFSGTLTGGNGRASSTGQTNYFQLRLPPGKKALNASVTTGNKNNTVFVALVDPRGEVVSASQNGLQKTSKSKLILEDGAQLHVVKPVAGVWTLIVDFYNSVSGTATTQPFTVHMNVNPVKASASGLPDSTGKKLASGKPVTAHIKIKNSGDVPEEYFVDARLSGKVNLPLVAQTTSTLTLPNLTGVVPTFLVPSLTTDLAAQVSAPSPNIFDLNWAFGDPDLASNIANTSMVNLSASDIPNGDWTVTPFLQGPDGATGPTPVTATVSAVARTNALDPTVTASTGDLWDQSTNPSATLTPIIVQPGQTVTIPVTITPNGTSGQVVSGTVYVSAVSFNPASVTFNFLPSAAPTASTVASFPYTYKIK
ncbi:MAG TPA: S8 family serine peptidase [Streptosporangiaceae bacterium]|nr:S8 family serine peptidase [Streptosporangiaceae bacterium]